MKSNRLKTILTLVTILVLPGFLYYLLREGGKNRYKTLPKFGEKRIADTFHTVKGKKISDTIYHTIADFELKNQNSEVLSFVNFAHKVMVVNLFFIDEQGFAIQEANKTMAHFSEIYGQNKMVSLVSVTVNPAQDNGKRLANYAMHIKAKAPKWNLLTGDDNTIHQFVTKGLLLDVVHHEDAPHFTHSNQFVLIDSQRRIRGYYDGMNKEAIDKLNDEIKVLIIEELRETKDGR